MTTLQPRVPSPHPPHFAVLTPPGRAAIATIAVRGTDALPLVARLFHPASGKPLTEIPIGRTVFGRFQIPLPSGEGAGRRPAGEGSHTSEDLVVGLLAPDELEIHCHGGKAAVEAICEALLAAGAAQRTSAAWVHEQQSDPIAADALLALADARTERTAAILLDQYRGALIHELTAIDNALANNDQATAASALHQLLARAELGLHLTQPWKVVLAGRPNAGKSSLMNALLGYQRSIVFHQPGTTRDVLTATTAIDGWPIELTDTAGLREGEAPAETVGQTFLSAAVNPRPDPIESEGIARAQAQIATADLVLFIADTTANWDHSLHQEIIGASYRPPLIIHNKCDLAAPSTDRPAGIPTSALTGHGLDHLCRAIISALIPAPPLPNTAVPFTTQQISVLQAAADHVHDGQPTNARQQLALLNQKVQ